MPTLLQLLHHIEPLSYEIETIASIYKMVDSGSWFLFLKLNRNSFQTMTNICKSNGMFVPIINELNFKCHCR